MENRIQKIIDEQGISLNAFAQEIGVNRSTISHILTGRNKPSVEVLQKILKRFPIYLRTGFCLEMVVCMLKMGLQRHHLLIKSLKIRIKICRESGCFLYR